MHRNEHRRTDAERNAAQPIGGQPRAEDDANELEQPEQVPSFLTARELQARDPARGADGPEDGGDRHGAAGFSEAGAAGEGEGEPTISDDEPPRGDRGMPMERSEKLSRGRGGKKK